MPATGFQGLLSSSPNASPPTMPILEWIICSTRTGHWGGRWEGKEGGGVWEGEKGGEMGREEKRE